MNGGQVWHVIDAQRRDVADLLERLTEDEWRRPSLCEGWTVRDVAGHLTLQQIGLRDLPTVLAAWRGSLDRTTRQAARRRAAALPTDRLVAEIRATVGSRKRNPGVSPLEPLIDILVHSQDIAIPLGRSLGMPAEAAATAATRALTMRWPPPPASARKMTGFRLTATDTPWSFGEGPEVCGPMAALLLLSTGRLVALPEVSGPGAAELAARLSA